MKHRVLPVKHSETRRDVKKHVRIFLSYEYGRGTLTPAADDPKDRYRLKLQQESSKQHPSDPHDKTRSLFQDQIVQQMDGLESLGSMGVLGLPVLSGQVGMRVDNRVGRKMVDMGKGNTSRVVADKVHYQQKLQYGIAKHAHLPWFLPAKIFISSVIRIRICHVYRTFT